MNVIKGSQKVALTYSVQVVLDFSIPCPAQIQGELFSDKQERTCFIPQPGKKLLTGLGNFGQQKHKANLWPG